MSELKNILTKNNDKRPLNLTNFVFKHMIVHKEKKYIKIKIRLGPSPANGLLL